MANTITLNGQQYAINSETPYIDAYNAYAQQQEELNKQQQAQLNSTYDSNARQAYVLNVQNRNALPEQLKAQGINGGASETALINLANNYGKNVANNEAARGTALSSLQQNYAQQMAEAQKEALENQAQYTDTLNQRKLEQYSATISRFNTVASCNAEISALAKSADPLKAEKIMLVQAQRALLQGTSSGSSYSSGNDDTTVDDNVKEQVINGLNNIINAAINSNKTSNSKKTGYSVLGTWDRSWLNK